MKKLAAIGLGVALAAATVTTAPQPAKADSALLLGGLIVGLVIAGHHHPTLRTLPPWSWFHTHWCESHYKTYNRHTNMYYDKPGHQRQCISPKQ